MGQSYNKQQHISSDRKLKTQRYQEITYYMTVRDRTFGDVQVYASNKKPLCYLAKVQHQQPNSSIFNIFSKIQNIQSKFLVNLFAFQIKRTEIMGLIQEKIVAYWEYYNFYLIDYLKTKQIKKIGLKQGQIWHIIQGCVNCCEIFQYFELQYEIDINNIIVTPQGKVKFYWHHLRKDKNHLNYYKKVVLQNQEQKNQNQKGFSTKNTLTFQKSDNCGFYLSPQEIFLINNKQFYSTTDFKKCNSYRLGMIIIFCVTLNNPALTCYNFNQSKIHKSVLASIIQNKLIDSQAYSKQLVQLVQFLLMEDQQKRIPINMIKTMYKAQFQKQYELHVSQKQKQIQKKNYTFSSEPQSPKMAQQQNKISNMIRNSLSNTNQNNRYSFKQANNQNVKNQDDLQERRTIKIKYNQSSNSSNVQYNNKANK